MATSNTKTAAQHIYPFGSDVEPPPLDPKILGGKGKGIAEMASIGLPVPPGFIITTTACNAFRCNKRQFPEGLEEGVVQSMIRIEKLMGKEFGSETNPLLVSVRSGGRASMPGMMDTVLNLGLNDRSVLGVAQHTQNERLAYDNYRRLIMMYADIVEGVGRKQFEKLFQTLKERENVTKDAELSAEGLKESCNLFKQLFQKLTNKEFPQDAYEQLFGAIRAVFNSWDSERATLYRHLHQIPSEWGTAANVQVMVFGNSNANSATGVGFTRDPATGANVSYG